MYKFRASVGFGLAELTLADMANSSMVAQNTKPIAGYGRHLMETCHKM